MQKLWTLCQAMGTDAMALLCEMHSKYTEKMPLLHTWPVGNAAFKNMPKYAQLNVLKHFFDLYAVMQATKKEEVQDLEDQFAAGGDTGHEAEKALKKELRIVRKRHTMTKKRT